MCRLRKGYKTKFLTNPKLENVFELRVFWGKLLNGHGMGGHQLPHPHGFAIALIFENHICVRIMADNRTAFQKNFDRHYDDSRKPVHHQQNGGSSSHDSVAERWAASLRRRDPELQPIFPSINPARNRFLLHMFSFLRSFDGYFKNQN